MTIRVGRTALLSLSLALAGCSIGLAGPGPTNAPDPVASPSPTTASATAPPLSTSTPAAPTEAPAATPRPTRSPRSHPLPRCRYADRPAQGDPDEDWATIVLDTIYRLPAEFAPTRLVSTARAGLQRGYEIIPAVVSDLRAMHEASIEADAEIAIRWAYRSYGEQVAAHNLWVSQVGEVRARQVSARPGHSEHGLGTAIDFRSATSLKPPWEYDDWATTKPGAWMMDHAWRFGFVLSYPKGMQDETCYDYEPWHYRYVGRDLAQQIHDSGLTPRRFLWELSQR